MERELRVYRHGSRASHERIILKVARFNGLEVGEETMPHGNNLDPLAAAAMTPGAVGLAAPGVIGNVDQVVTEVRELLSDVDAVLARIVDRFEST
ncbi:hypothetical protein [Lentzea californiensis]|uniref:hypothetical protein n=1 Tax=Lentzea californiensis TaxID=438851 RepID=UPI002164BA9F|nr:hypothetical protein [Lentzea californiensis]MCR3748797.1 hypothetical protein [Lentzea californiensis]